MATPSTPQLTGRLVQKGTPLANVVLRLYTSIDYVPTACAATVTTAADGTFATPGLTTVFWLRAEAPTVALDWETPHQTPLHASRDLGDVEPPVAVSLDVHVIDEAGRPVAEPCCWSSRSEIQVGLDSRDARTPRLVRGDANGQVRLEGLYPGQVYLKVSAEGFAMARVVLEAGAVTKAPLQVTLTRGARLVGRVFDWRGQPLPGAIASGEGREAVTDATGAFVFEAYAGAESIHVEAKGHQSWWSGTLGRQTDFAHIQLERAVVLRGIVHGSNAATSVVLAEAPDRARELPWPGPREKIARLLPVAPDGTFAIEGLTPSDYLVHARAENLGASAGQRVNLRSEATVELTIDRTAAIALRIVDAAEHPVDPVEVVCNLTIIEYPSLFGPYGTEIPARVFNDFGRLSVTAVGGVARVPTTPDEPLALGVRSRGFLPVVRTFEAGEAPRELTIELQRGGIVRGIVRGGLGAAYSRQVSIWTANDDAAVRARQVRAKPLAIDAQGRFESEALPPGDYRAAVYRYGRACIGNRPDEQIGAVPLVDEDEDLRDVVAFTLVAGTTTDIDLDEPKLGTLRGRVLLSGAASEGAWVVAARPGAKLFAGIAGGGEVIDWDDEISLQFVSGQRSGRDGSFTFLYRDAGPLEVRVRHAEGAATMPPVVVELPLPGADVHRDIDLALGGIRGRFVRGAARWGEAVLLPSTKAADDPFCQLPEFARVCARCDIGDDGAFRFAGLPDGEWVVRVRLDWAQVAWQRRVVVAGNAVDLGMCEPLARVPVRLRWAWPSGEVAPGTVHGVWLRDTNGGNGLPVWVATLRTDESGILVGSVMPGSYQAVAFGSRSSNTDLVPGFFGVHTADLLSRPFPIEVRSDCSTVPAALELVPEPANGR